MSRRALVEILCFLLLLFALLYGVWTLWWLLKIPMYDDVSLRMGLREGLVKAGIGVLYLAASVGLGIIEELYEDLEARRWAAGVIELPAEDGLGADDDDDSPTDDDDDDAPEADVAAEPARPADAKSADATTAADDEAPARPAAARKTTGAGRRGTRPRR